ncbi:MAG: hypothetical protein OJF50_004985 [Nitrospira sp.]|nr:hypothetical protein [Nitrospira sp.]
MVPCSYIAKGDKTVGLLLMHLLRLYSPIDEKVSGTSALMDLVYAYGPSASRRSRRVGVPRLESGEWTRAHRGL